MNKLLFLMYAIYVQLSHIIRIINEQDNNERKIIVISVSFLKIGMSRAMKIKSILCLFFKNVMISHFYLSYELFVTRIMFFVVIICIFCMLDIHSLVVHTKLEKSLHDNRVSCNFSDIFISRVC